MLPQSLKGFTAFANGRGYIGRLNSGQLPKVAIKSEDFRDGGMDVPIELDMGQDKMEAAFGFAEYDPDLMTMWGLLDGSMQALTLRGSMEGEDGTAVAIIGELRGLIKETDPGDWKSGGDKAELKLTMAVRYYHLTIDAAEVFEIDAENVIRKIGGVDQLAARRQNLGI
jgi:P2 family phage contractile tail tube protein